MAGYSGTPLIKKLGITEGDRVAFVNEPPEFGAVLGELPAGITKLIRPRAPMNFILLFTKRSEELAARFPTLAAMLTPAGMLWVAWPKKSAKVATDITFDVVHRIGLDTGLVDVKICAIDEVWSALKFVIRVKDRPRT